MSRRDLVAAGADAHAAERLPDLADPVDPEVGGVDSGDDGGQGGHRRGTVQMAVGAWPRSRTTGRSASGRQIGSTPNERRCSSMKALISAIARSSSAREESRGRLQDLVGPPELAVLPLELLDPGALFAGQAGS